MKQNETEVREGDLLSQNEIPEAKVHEVTVFQPAADWNNSMLGAFDKAIKNANVDLERVRELLRLQKELRQENAKLEFNAAMARVQARIVPVVKNKYNKQTDSWYADLHEICNMVTPIYSSEGFSASFSTAYGTPEAPLAEGWTRTVLTLAHVAGFEKQYAADYPIDNKGMKDDKPNKTITHGIKSSRTYARNDLITMAFNIAQKNADDDGNAAGRMERGGQVEVISDEQYDALVEALALKNLSAKWLASTMRVDELDRIPVDRYEIAINTIQKAKAQAHPPRG